jgi:hypothetical protein
LEFNSSWTDASGYVPIRIKLSNSSPSPAPREITFRLKAASWFPGSPVIEQWHTVTVPAGSGSVAEQISFPLYAENMRLMVEVWEGTTPLRSLWPSTPFINSVGAQVALPRFLFLSNQGLPDRTALSQALPEANNVQSLLPTAPASATNARTQYPLLLHVNLRDLPLRWLDYTSADVVVISWPDLLAIANPPAQFDALRRWLLAGGNLIVDGLDQEFSQTDELATRLTLPPNVEVTSTTAVPESWPRLGHWRCPLPEQFGLRIDAIDQLQNQAVTAEEKAEKPALPAHPGFVWREAAMGRVIAVAGDAFPATDQQWRWILNTFGDERWDWSRRHGINMLQPNDDFWSFLIPGVGLAPVAAFQWLITLFVIAIGPVNYWILWRRKRLQWIVVTAPLLAFAVTLGLFGYAFASDGLAIRLRSRTYTEIDQRAQQLSAWSHLSYYAGMAPSTGLWFPGDVAVFPIDPTGFAQSSFGSQQRWFEWQGDRQHFLSGWLLSRTPTQFLTVRQSPTSANVSVREQNGQVQLSNRLGVPIHGGIIRLADGTFYRCDSVVHEATGALSPLDRELALTEMRSLGRGVAITRDPALHAASGFWFTRQRLYYPSPQYQSTSFSSSLLEGQLRNSVALMPWEGDLPPRSYVFMTGGAPEFAAGVESFESEAGFHIVTGRW